MMYTSCASSQGRVERERRGGVGEGEGKWREIVRDSVGHLLSDVSS